MSEQNFMSYGDAETIFTEVQTKKFSTGNVSTVQTTLTATKAYNQNDPFVYNGQLYKADEPIAQGGTITIGTNASETTIEELLSLKVTVNGGEVGDTVVTFSDPSADAAITSGSPLKTIIGLIKYKFAHLINGHTIVNSSGSSQTARTKLKFTGSATVTDDSTNDQTIVNITGGGSGGHTILNGSGSAMNQRSKLQFVGATVTDDSSNDKTIITTTPQSMIGDAWVTSHAYAVGDYCIDGNVLYKCKTAHTSSASYRPPYASYWDAVSVASQLGSGTSLDFKRTNTPYIVGYVDETTPIYRVYMRIDFPLSDSTKQASINSQQEVLIETPIPYTSDSFYYNITINPMSSLERSYWGDDRNAEHIALNSEHIFTRIVIKNNKWNLGFKQTYNTGFDNARLFLWLDYYKYK